MKMVVGTINRTRLEMYEIIQRVAQELYSSNMPSLAPIQKYADDLILAAFQRIVAVGKLRGPHLA